MDDRLDRLERLAALHREGALTDDEFREEKLRVLGGRRIDEPPEPAGPPPVSPAMSKPVPAPVAPSEWAEEPEPRFVDLPAEPAAPSRRRGVVVGLAVAAVIAVLIAAVLFARSISVDAPRSSVGSAESRQASPRDSAALDAVPENAMAAEPEAETETETPERDVASALELSDPSRCRFGTEGREAFDALLSRSGGEWAADGPVRLGAVTLTPKLEVSQVNPVPPAGAEPRDDTAAAPQVEPSIRYYASARAPDGVVWNGLRFSRLVRSHLSRPDGGSLDRRSLTFLEDPDQVRRTLARAGVDVPPDGRALGGACSGTMRVEAIPGGSALTCERRCD